MTGRQVELLGRREDRLELAHPVHGDDHAAPELLREQRRLDERAVLVAVAEDQRLGVLLQRERDQQLRLRAGLDPEVEGAPVLHQLLDDVALLVDLDRVDAAERAPVLVLHDRLLEGAEQLRQARLQDVGEPDEDRQVQAAAAEVVHQLLQVDLEGARTGGRHRHVAGLVDREEVAAPAPDVVQLGGIPDRPGPEFSLQRAAPSACPLNCGQPRASGDTPRRRRSIANRVYSVGRAVKRKALG